MHRGSADCKGPGRRHPDGTSDTCAVVMPTLRGLRSGSSRFETLVHAETLGSAAPFPSTLPIRGASRLALSHEFAPALRGHQRHAARLTAGLRVAS